MTKLSELKECRHCEHAIVMAYGQWMHITDNGLSIYCGSAPVAEPSVVP